MIPANPDRRRRKFLVRLIYVWLSLVVSVATVELVARSVLRSIADDARYYERLEANVVRSAAILEPSRQPGTFDAKFGSVLSPNATLETARTWQDPDRAHQLPRFPGPRDRAAASRRISRAPTRRFLLLRRLREPGRDRRRPARTNERSRTQP